MGGSSMQGLATMGRRHTAGETEGCNVNTAMLCFVFFPPTHEYHDRQYYLILAHGWLHHISKKMGKWLFQI